MTSPDIAAKEIRKLIRARAAVLKERGRKIFGADSQIAEKMIHPRNGDFAVASFRPEGRLRRVSRPAQGPERQYRHG